MSNYSTDKIRITYYLNDSYALSGEPFREFSATFGEDGDNRQNTPSQHPYVIDSQYA